MQNNVIKFIIYAKSQLFKLFFFGIYLLIVDLYQIYCVSKVALTVDNHRIFQF